MVRLPTSFRAFRPKYSRSAKYGGGIGTQQRSQGLTLQQFTSKGLPCAAGLGLAWLGYEQLKLDGHVVHGAGGLFRKAYAEAPEEDYRQVYAQMKTEAKQRTRQLLNGTALGPLFSRADDLLKKNECTSIMDGIRTDTCTVPSNSIGEDRSSNSSVSVDFGGWKEKLFAFSIFDGHAGDATAQLLQDNLEATVFQYIAKAVKDKSDTLKNESKTRLVSDPCFIRKAIKTGFLSLDASISGTAEATMENPANVATSPWVITALAPALSGSCALYALFQYSTSILRVATVGDSRAVLGRAIWTGEYTAMPLSVDQTGFNPSEKARLSAEHPGETGIIDDKTGRLFGLAVTRAFGDARWKWPDERMIDAQKRFWSHGPRPNNVIKTPPYLTALPEITETKIKMDQPHPDFLIMASDGFWDHMSNENAVLCVEQWIEAKTKGLLGPLESSIRHKQLLEENEKGSKLDLDLFHNEAHQGDLEWRIEPKHFVVEDENCATHLIRNVLGGKRRTLFAGLMSLQPPLSRSVRDDITVHVIFFGKV